MRVVLDTNILVRANPLTSPAGLAHDLLFTIASSPAHTLVLSAAILNEARRVLAYSHVRRRWPLADEAIEAYVSTLAAVSFILEDRVPIRHQ